MTTTSSGSLTISDLAGSPRRHRRERLLRGGAAAAAIVSLVVSALIILSLIFEAWTFIRGLDLHWLWGDQWAPPFNEYDLKTPIVGTLIVTGVAMLVAIPVGMASAIFLSEYAPAGLRRFLKPVLEVLAGIPSVVLGFFALRWINPNITQRIVDDAGAFTLLSAGIGVGILVVPLIASVTEDALASVPNALREASAGVGARKATTTLRIVLPAAVSGIVAAMIIGVSRAIGETMVVFLAAGGGGNQASFTANPFEPGTTMTAAMAATVAPSDRVSEGISLQSLFFVGLLLFVMTFVLNIIADRFVRRVRTAY